MKPLMDDSKISWRTMLDPETVPAETRMLKVEGTYQHITYTGHVCIGDSTSDQIFSVINHLKAGITHLIINALDKEEMDRRAGFMLDPLEETPDGAHVTRSLAAVLDGDLKTTKYTTLKVPVEDRDMLEDGSEDLEELLESAKMAFWTEWRKEELV